MRIRLQLFLVLALALFCAATSSRAEEPQPAEPQVVAPAEGSVPGEKPDIDLPERVRDAGEVTQGEPATYTFKVKNSGKDTLKILEARASCGCTVADYDRTVAPGAVGKITASVSTKNFRPGPFTKTVTIRSNDPDEPQILLQLKGTVISYAAAFPQSLFIQTDRLSPTTQDVYLRAHESNPFEVKAVGSNVTWLEVTWKKVTKLPYDGKPAPGMDEIKVGDFHIQVGTGKNPPLGTFDGDLFVQTTSAKTPKVDIPIRGTVTGLITAYPNRLYMRLSPPPEKLTPTVDELKIRRESSIQAPEVGSVRKGEELVVLSTAPGTDGQDWVRVRAPSGVIGWAWKNLTQRTGGPEAKVPAEQVTRKLQIKKAQGSPFKILRVESTIQTLLTSFATVEDGRSYEVTINYKGDMVRGMQQGDIVIQTDDKEEPTLKVPVTLQVT